MPNNTIKITYIQVFICYFICHLSIKKSCPMKNAASWDSRSLRLESEPHRMPYDAAVDGFIAYAFIGKAERRCFKGRNVRQIF